MGKMGRVHLDGQEAIRAVLVCLANHDGDAFGASADLMDYMADVGWKSPTEVEVERQRMLSLFSGLCTAAYNLGPHSEEADTARANIVLQARADHRISCADLGITAVGVS